MNKTKTILAALLLSMSFAGNSPAQTPSPSPSATPTPNPNAGTYQDTKLSIPQRIQLADSVVTSGSSSESAVASAAAFMLSIRPVAYLLTFSPTFASSVLTDPTLGGEVSGDDVGLLTTRAIEYHLDTIPALDDKIAYLSPLVQGADAANVTANQMLELKGRYAGIIALKAAKLNNQQDYAGAISTASAVLGWGGASSPEIAQILRAKIALRSSDVLSWAKLVYFQSLFGQSQTGIDAVSSAYRALDVNLVRANAFIQYQKDGVGTNPLASVPLPAVTFLLSQPIRPMSPVLLLHSVAAMNDAVAGDNLGALKVAVQSFSTAPSGKGLNAATALVAQWLRNFDGNLVRANAFVTAQTQGLPYTIPELQQ